MKQRLALSLDPIRAAEELYKAHRHYVLSVLARRCLWLDEGDQEALFHDGFVVMLAKQREGTLDTAAMRPKQLRAYLVQTALNKALDERKSARHQRSAPLTEEALDVPDDGATPEDLAATSIDGAVTREIIAELSERQQQIVQLRFFVTLTPEEIQAFLEITERTYRRELEEALKTVSERYTLVREGRFCESRRSVILAYVAEIAGPNRARDAREHLRNCRGCAQWAAGLRSATQHAAALMPLPVISIDGRFAGATDAVSAVHQHIADLASSAKHHALSIGTRVDPSAGYLTSARPGAIAATVAGCIAIGSGATYCTLEGIPTPWRTPAEAHVAERKPAKQRPKPTPVAQATSTPQAPRTAPKSQAAPKRRRSTSKQPTANDPVAVAREFGIEGSSPPASTPRPKPAPAQPPNEFGP